MTPSFTALPNEMTELRPLYCQHAPWLSSLALFYLLSLPSFTCVSFPFPHKGKRPISWPSKASQCGALIYNL